MRNVLKIIVASVGLFALPGGMAFAADALKITVIGGSGMIGQRIVREALDRGHHVTIVARDPARVTEKHERLTVATGDVLDFDGIAKIASDQDVVVSAVGVARAKKPDYMMYLKAADSLITALRSLGEAAPRLIVVGGVGTLKDASGALLLERVPADRKPEHLGQKAALDFLRTVDDVKWTYVSPPARIAPGERTGAYRLGDDQPVTDDQGTSSISMEDYAVALVDEAEKPQHMGRRFTVGY